MRYHITYTSAPASYRALDPYAWHPPIACSNKREVPRILRAMRERGFTAPAMHEHNPFAPQCHECGGHNA